MEGFKNVLETLMVYFVLFDITPVLSSGRTRFDRALGSVTSILVAVLQACCLCMSTAAATRLMRSSHSRVDTLVGSLCRLLLRL